MLLMKILFIIFNAIIIVFMQESTCVNVGSTVFYNKNARSQCWSQVDIAKLRARQVFEKLALPSPSPEKINVKYAKDVIRYFKTILHAAEDRTDEQTGVILKESISDMIGGHLRYEILPTARFSYYAGYVPYRNVRSLHSFFDDLKNYLNTQGLGWTQPQKIPRWSNMTVAKILIGPSKLFDPCSRLITRRDINSCIHLPTPKVDDSEKPSAIALPFISGGFTGLTSPRSENVLLKYYTTASKCILRHSPPKCRHADFLAFNNDLWHWMKRDVAPHLADEKVYVAYAGILRVAAAVQNYGRGLSRRNLFDAEIPSNTIRRWHPWKSLSESYVYMNADWSPQIYVIFVVMIALGICLLQICQNYVFKSSGNCYCAGVKGKTDSKKYSFDTKEVAYTSVESNIPAILPKHPQSAVFITDRNRIKKPSKIKTVSLASIKKQKVYDLNENTEKIMAVIISDNENQDSGGASAVPTVNEDVTEESDDEYSTKLEKCRRKRSKSPPKIDSQISHLRIKKSPVARDEKIIIPTFSTSGSITHSEMTFTREPVVSESVWSGTGSSTSESSTTLKTQSRRTRMSRDLAWARRVISKHSTEQHNITITKSTSQTETSHPTGDDATPTTSRSKE